ncbi:MAG: hypothetical protein ACK5LX_13215 [Oscillospiraceae bacterium]
MSLPSFQALLADFRQSAFAASLPTDALYSLPVLHKGPAGLCDSFFVYKKSRSSLVRPIAWALLPIDGTPGMSASCAALDFVPTADYPLGGEVSAHRAAKLSAKRETALTDELLLFYEELREFAFAEPLSQDREGIVARYRTLFTELCPEGLLPFYYALSPPFFHWAGLPLPEEVAAEPAEEGDGTPELSAKLAEISTGLDALSEQFRKTIATDTRKNRLFDELHDELQRYRNDFMEQLTLPIERDVILIIDSVRRSLEKYREEVPGEELCGKLLRLLGDVEVDLTDLLYRQGVDPFCVENDDNRVQVPRQKVLSTLPTDEPALDKTVAKRLAPGWERGDRVVRQEHVIAYLYAEPERPPQAKKPPAKKKSRRKPPPGKSASNTDK